MDKLQERLPTIAGNAVMFGALFYNLPASSLRRLVLAGVVGGVVSVGTTFALELRRLARAEQPTQ